MKEICLIRYCNNVTAGRSGGGIKRRLVLCPWLSCTWVFQTVAWVIKCLYHIKESKHKPKGCSVFKHEIWNHYFLFLQMFCVQAKWFTCYIYVINICDKALLNQFLKHCKRSLFSISIFFPLESTWTKIIWIYRMTFVQLLSASAAWNKLFPSCTTVLITTDSYGKYLY